MTGLYHGEVARLTNFGVVDDEKCFITLFTAYLWAAHPVIKTQRRCLLLMSVGSQTCSPSNPQKKGGLKMAASSVEEPTLHVRFI